MSSITAQSLNELDESTSGIVDASAITEVIGLASDVNTAYSSAGISGLGNEIVTLTDTTLLANVLNVVNGHTSGVINASSINTLTGAAADLNTVYAANGSGVSGLGNEAITLSDSSLAASVLNTLDGNSSGVINAGSINID